MSVKIKYIKTPTERVRVLVERPQWREYLQY